MASVPPQGPTGSGYVLLYTPECHFRQITTMMVPASVTGSHFSFANSRIRNPSIYRISESLSCEESEDEAKIVLEGKGNPIKGIQLLVRTVGRDFSSFSLSKSLASRKPGKRYMLNLLIITLLKSPHVNRT